MTKNPLIPALCASGYIFVVAILMRYVVATQQNKPDPFLAPVVFLSVLTLSVAVMAYLFFYEPLQFLIDGKRKEAAHFFLQTAGIFAILTIVISVFVFLGNI